jgi:FkbH-like protein
MEHIVAHRINWESKFKSLESLANELNLGIDSFVFLDDNPVECGQIREVLPKVITLQVPPDNEVESFLQNIWLFDKLTVTEEDAKRTQMYRENAARQQIEDSTTDIAAFLASLELVIEVDTPDEDEWPRVAQLTQRTNQFNFTTIRRNEPDIRALALSGEADVMRVKVRDRFGDYGLVGITISRKTEDALNVDTMLLSCRVLGRGVEHSMLRKLGEMAKSAGLSRVDLPYVLTPKNEPARAFADHVALAFKVGNESSCVYRIPVDEACKIAHIPGGDPDAIIEAKRADAKKKPKSEANLAEISVSSSERYETIARMLNSGKVVMSNMRMSTQRERGLETTLVPADTPIEHELLAIWKELLGIPDLGVEDDYFSLGGTSLIAARLFAEIARRFDVKLRLTTILDAPTVRSLANYIKPNQAAGNNVLITLKKGSGKTLFLVHDGDGETLLYKNLAGRMPDNMQVIGIEPRSLPNIPLAHSSIEDMAAFYVEAIRQKQPTGPYLLGGMCAGGLISYEMGVQLERVGEKVDLIAILDAATPTAPKRVGRITQDRAKRIAGLKTQAKSLGLTGLIAWLFIFGELIKKVLNTLWWEFSSRVGKQFVRLRFIALKFILKQNKEWPKFLAPLTVRNIFNQAEISYQMLKNDKLEGLLVRATKGSDDDIPFKEVYSDESLGWHAILPQLRIVDVEGGHASMLQEPYVASLSQALISYLNKSSKGKS